MKKLIRFAVGIIVPAFILAGGVANSAAAQDKAKAAKAEPGKVTVTVLAENDKVRVFETRFKPGDVNAAPPATSTRVVRVLKGGSQIWTYADGKTVKNEYKTGEVRIVAPGPQFTTKNVGKTEIFLYVVQLK
jgi:mannose-6-phosphate isomerase-like protein (cupin superfamily)